MASTAGATVRPLRDDRFLIGILAGIGLLLILALAAILLLRGSTQEFPVTTPAGTVQRFLRALEGQQYDAAYGYLSDAMGGKPSREEFARYNADAGAYDAAGTRLRIERESISDAGASVVVRVTHHTNGLPPFGSEWTTTETFTLRREGGIWQITSLPYRYWPPIYIR